MSRTIWKFVLAPSEQQDIAMPVGAVILCVQVQAGAVCLWAAVDPTAPVTSRRFGVFGTGHPLPDEAQHYLGSVQLFGGSLVFHVYTLAAGGRG